MKKTLGYGFKLSGESLSEALSTYKDGFSRNKKEVVDDIKRGKDSLNINPVAKPKIFKVTVEIL